MRVVGHWKSAVQCVALAALVSLSGCSNGKLGVYPVHGMVKVDGQPAEGAMVIFCPVGGNDKLQRERPFATTASDGSFTLTTFVKDDGAPSGDYKVLVQWIVGKAAAGADRDRADGPPDKLHGRYMNLEKTTVTAKVDGATELPPFELKSQ